MPWQVKNCFVIGTHSWHKNVSSISVGGWCVLLFSPLFFYFIYLLSFLCIFTEPYSSRKFTNLNRCWDLAMLYPPENPIMCHYARPSNDTFVVGCCKDYDMCNRDLKPVLHVRNTSGKEWSYLTLAFFFGGALPNLPFFNALLFCSFAIWVVFISLFVAISVPFRWRYDFFFLFFLTEITKQLVLFIYFLINTHAIYFSLFPPFDQILPISSHIWFLMDGRRTAVSAWSTRSCGVEMMGLETGTRMAKSSAWLVAKIRIFASHHP